jgi:16S rRNA (guanine966-N2)-methyltransferase
VREALFSILGQDLSGCSVLDAFGGSGLLGLEAWSRGAQLTVLEQDPKAAAVIRDNAAALGCPLVLHRGDTLLMSIALGTFDLVLADPPYAADPKPILAALAPCVGGRLVLETDSSATPPADVAGLHCENHRSFGTTTLWFYRGEHG